MNFKGQIGLLLPCCLLVLAGCGKSGSTPASVSGTLSYKGTPIKAGMMTFYAKEGGVYPVPIQANGTYSARSMPAGEMTVTIETESANPKKPTMTYGGGRGGKAGAGGKGGGAVGPRPEYASEAPKGEYTAIPRKYADPKTSNLTVTLVAGKNEHPFDLTD